MRTRISLITLLLAIALSLGLSAQAQAEGGGLRDALSSFGQKLGLMQSSPQEHPFLEPDLAFLLSAEAAGPDRIAVHFRIADGYYLYRKMFGYRIVATGGVALGEAEYPTGKFKEDEFFGRMEVYVGAVEARLPVIRDDAARGRLPVLLEVDFQGCAEAGFCYPPMTREITLVLPAMDNGVPGASGMMNDGGASPNDSSSSRFDARASSPETGPNASARQAIDALPASGFQLVSIGADGAGALPAQDRFARSLAEGALWLNLALFFGLGLLLAFTPCVFPMVPILSSLIIGQKGGVTTGRAFGLSLAFVLAMALTYTAAGVLAGLFGSNLQILFQNTWIIVAFSAVFVLLALSMFGFYELQMPSAWQTRLSRAGNGSGGSYAGAGAMGFFSALIVGPCVAAPLAGILIYIGMSGDALLGGLSLFALSLGMGMPLLAVGASAGRLLPKVGPWMATVKVIFGILMLGVAIWLLERIIPPQAAMLFWAALMIGAAVWAGSFDAIRNGVSLRFRAARTAGLVMLMYGAVVFVGALTGGRDVLQPLAGSSVAALGGFEAPKTLEFQDTRGLDGLRDAVAVAAADGRPSMLFFHAEWCVDCNTMKRRTFIDPGVQQLLAGAVLLDTDVTAYDGADQALLGQYGLFGPPAVLFFDAQGRELAAHRLVGHSGPRDFSARVRSAWP